MSSVQTFTLRLHSFMSLSTTKIIQLCLTKVDVFTTSQKTLNFILAVVRTSNLTTTLQFYYSFDKGCPAGQEKHVVNTFTFVRQSCIISSGREGL
jgi:hypothetical protein